MSKLAEAETYKSDAQQEYSGFEERIRDIVIGYSNVKLDYFKEKATSEVLKERFKVAEAKLETFARAIEDEKLDRRVETAALKEQIRELQKEREDALAALDGMKEVAGRIENEGARLMDFLEADRRARESNASAEKVAPEDDVVDDIIPGADGGSDHRVSSDDTISVD